jgi:glucose-1-phosphate thymidylyltransferase
VCNEKVEEIAFIIGDFGREIEESLCNIALKLDAKPKIYYQTQPLGTAHAILCAKNSLKGNCVVAFADTLFKAKFKLDKLKDGIIWVSKIDDPSSFGVVQLDTNNNISAFIEKPEKFVSDLAIIGIYYFNDGEYLREELQYLIDNNIKEKGEYQLTNALENMQKKGKVFSPGRVQEWLDCGNKTATIHTNQRVLVNKGSYISKKAKLKNSKIIEPCYVSSSANIKNSVIGPYVSIGPNTEIENCKIKNTILQGDSTILNAKLYNSMIGRHVFYDSNNTKQTVSLGDYTEVK